MEPERAELEAFYRRYLQLCNEHRFDELGAFVAPHVEINGEALGRPAYAEGLAAVVELFPDFSWELRHLLIDGSWLSSHLVDTGTTATGRSVRTPEFAVYRVAGGKIVEVWGDLDRDRLAREVAERSA